MITADPNALFIEGAISTAHEDVEGNMFDPSLINTDKFLSEGFLDIDHLQHKFGIKESVVGRPVKVWRDGKRLFARFQLAATDLGREIYEYVKKNPYVLSFSIAGGLEKPYFERGGSWDVRSCAITHSPMQPNAYAIALSAHGHVMSLHSVMSAFYSDLVHKTVDVTNLSSLYQYFKGMSDPIQSIQLAAWAHKRFSNTIKMEGYRAPTDIMNELRQNLFYPEQETSNFVLETRAHLAQWKLFHPEDEHLDREGTFMSVEDAIAHLRYCERLNPIQVATILGRLRGKTEIIKNWAS